MAGNGFGSCPKMLNNSEDAHIDRRVIFEPFERLQVGYRGSADCKCKE